MRRLDALENIVFGIAFFLQPSGKRPEGTHVSVNGLQGKAALLFGAEIMIGIPGFAFQQGFDKCSRVVESERANPGRLSAILHECRKAGELFAIPQNGFRALTL
jgi:hypothetical protein